mgnify:CR=1 FL=1
MGQEQKAWFLLLRVIIIKPLLERAVGFYIKMRALISWKMRIGAFQICRKLFCPLNRNNIIDTRAQNVVKLYGKRARKTE